MSTWTFKVYDDPSEYFRRVDRFLMKDEAEHNLLLGILDQLVTGQHDYESPILLGAVERAGEVHGCVWRTPPFKLGLTRLPEESIPMVVHVVAERYPDLEKVLGPVEVAVRFAELWSERKGMRFRAGMRQGIYRLERVIPPATYPPGSMRAAGLEDLRLISDWTEGLSREIGLPIADADVTTRRLLDGGRIYVWEAGERQRSMVAAAAYTTNGVRVAYVYTPEQDRGRGYATVLVARFSRLMLDSGRSFCFLYADQSNPTSTGIYRRIGYELVAEAIDAEFFKV